MKRSKSTIPADRFSALPQEIIHHILSFLPTKAATRTSALSKTFSSCWKSYPAIDLKFMSCCSNKSKIEVRDFTDLVNRTIQRRDFVKEVSIDLYGTSVSTKVSSFFQPRTIPHMSSITTLELTHVPLYYFNFMDFHLPALERLKISNCYGLKHFNFSSTRIRSIWISSSVGLRSVVIESSSLETFDLYLLEDNKCKTIAISECSKSLKNLTLHRAHIRDSWIRDNVPNFIHLANLQIFFCTRLKYSRIVNDNLKILRLITYDDRLKSIEIEAANLKVMVLNVLELRSIRFISTMHHLTEIKLGRFLPQESVIEFLKESVPKFLRLETLIICTADWDLCGIEITHQNLKRLILSFEPSCLQGDFVEQDSQDITLNTPKLVSLKYRGRAKPAFRVLSPMNLLDAELEIFRFLSDNYFVKLWEIIQTFSHSKLVKLSYFRDEDLVFSKELRQKLIAQISDCKHVQVELRSGIEKISIKLVESILWLFPSIQTLWLYGFSSGQLKKKTIKFQHHSTKEEANRRKHWRFFLKTVEFYNFEAFERSNLQKHFMKKVKYMAFACVST